MIKQTSFKYKSQTINDLYLFPLSHCNNMGIVEYKHRKGKAQLDRTPKNKTYEQSLRLQDTVDVTPDIIGHKGV